MLDKEPLFWYNKITKWISTKTNFRVNFMKGEFGNA